MGGSPFGILLKSIASLLCMKLFWLDAGHFFKTLTGAAVQFKTHNKIHNIFFYDKNGTDMKK